MTCAAAGIADPLGPHYKARGNMASSPSPPLPRPPLRIAIVGGGFAGCCAAAALHAALPPSSAEVVLFDMGGRGAGGRCSHRRVRRADSVVLPDDAPPPSPAEVMEFDHGAQFFRAKSQVMCRLARHWVRRGWAAEWQGRFGRLSAAEGAGAAASQPSPIDFFGCPPPPSEPLYVGVGGMQTICRQVLARDAPGVAVHRGARVSQVEWVAADGGKGGRWRLYGTVGRAALHDTPEAEAADVASPSRLDGGTFDLLLMTDVSSSFGTWHRASAGLREGPAACIAQRVGSRPRVPLFAALVAFRRPRDAVAAERAVPLHPPFDAFTVNDSEVLWFAARNNSKPSFPGGVVDGDETLECWTLVSTAAFAVKEIRKTTMQDEGTGAFVAQDPAYLNGPGGPSCSLLREFRKVLSASAGGGSSAGGYGGGDIVYLQGQRWGSALPQPVHRLGSSCGCDDKGDRIVQVMGVEYDPTPGGFAPPPRSGGGDEGVRNADADPYYWNAEEASVVEEAAKEFEQDVPLGFFYAGDFCSRLPGRNPGIEAACLSGLAAARCMVAEAQSRLSL